mmetsp:Transcript_9685/g.8305  ORF Transcript_9685/g.8305 Transcript_9685/m.8305 type:complete len:93 (-) Transcript_9685:265-543(-)
MQQSKDLLDDILQIGDEDAIPTLDDTEKAASVYNNLLEYAGTTDCEAEGDFTQTLEDATEKYLDKFTSGLLNDSIANESPKVLVEDQFGVYA